MQLRKWQAEALAALRSAKSKDFLAVATPGAGKTSFALSAAAEMLNRGEVSRIVVVAPTEHLKRQWADAAARFGIMLDPTWTPNASLAATYQGIVVTYAGVSVSAERHQRAMTATPTLVVLDEVHHAGDSLAWGDAVRTAFAGATRRLLLSGSPWRSDVNPIPFVSYAPGDDGVLRSRADYTYGYASALADKVVRPVVFMAYSGSARWRDRDGSELEANLDAALTRSLSARALRSALDPKSDWVSSVLAAADARLTQLRLSVPDAGGLVLASNKTHARAYARKLEAYTGEKVTVVVSEDAGASDQIERFAASTDRWIVAVRMISEGVDVPRLGIGVYATNSATSLFFTQAVGRFVRARSEAETATVFLPAVPSLLALSAEVERERQHALVLKEASAEEELARANRTERGVDLEAYDFEALGAEAHFERVIVNGVELGPSADDRLHAEDQVLTFSTVESVAELMRGAAPGVPMHRLVHEARKKLAHEVSVRSHDTGMTHAQIHTYLRDVCGGPVVASATLEELEARIERLAADARPEPHVPHAREPEAAEQLSLFG